MSDRKILGEILGLALRDLGNHDDYELVKSGSFRFHAETEGGWGGIVEVDIADMCAEASEKIEKLQKQNADLKANNTIYEIEKRLSRAERLLESLMKDFTNDQ